MMRQAYKNLLIFGAVIFFFVPAYASIPMANSNAYQADMAKPLSLLDYQKETDLTVPPPFTPPLKEDIKENPPVVIEAPLVQEPLTPEKAEPIDLGEPVEEAPITKINPESLGILSDSNGGLGAAMWKGTSRRMIDRLMPALNLPLSSSVLNNLARRFLLTVAAVPEEEENLKSRFDLTSLRIEKLLELGDVSQAWALSTLVKSEVIDEKTLRHLTHAALVKNGNGDICPLIPKIVASHHAIDADAAEWQKALIFCQLKKDDKKAVQLSLDLLREQNVKDDPFLELIDRNVLKDKKKLPRHLKDLNSINFGVLRYLDLPLPSLFYENPKAALIPDLLQAKAVDDKAKLVLAERAAQAGEISASQLGDVFKSISFSEKDIKDCFNSEEEGVRAHALNYQAALAAPFIPDRLEIVMNFLNLLQDRALVGEMGKLVASLVEDISVMDEYGIFAPQAVRLFALSGNPDQAMKWRKLGQMQASQFPERAKKLAFNWPFFVLSGIESDGDYAQGMKEWLAEVLTSEKPDQEPRRRDYAGQVLLLLAAAGYAVPEDAWLRVTVAMPVQEGRVSSPILLERLERVSKDGRKGEAVLISLLLADGEEPIPLDATIAIVRAFGQVGLKAEAQIFAREAVSSMTIN